MVFHLVKINVLHQTFMQNSCTLSMSRINTLLNIPISLENEMDEWSNAKMFPLKCPTLFMITIKGKDFQ